MVNCIEKYWKLRLDKCKNALEKNNFEEKSFPKGRIKVVLINEDIGL